MAMMMMMLLYGDDDDEDDDTQKQKNQLLHSTEISKPQSFSVQSEFALALINALRTQKQIPH